jgi:hypothetical protein
LSRDDLATALVDVKSPLTNYVVLSEIAWWRQR